MTTSIVFQQNYTAWGHVVVNQGGTNSGKTYSILQVLFCLACAQPNQVITVAGQDIPKLKAGALRDAASIHQQPVFNQMVKSYNRTDRIYHFINGSITTTKFNRWKFSPLPSLIAVYDFYGDDPRMNITGVKHLLIEQPDPFFGVKVQARTSYDIHSGNLIPSAGVELKLGPFDLGGRYYYSIAHQQWQPIVSGTLNLLDIK